MVRDAITVALFFAGVALSSVALLDWLGYSLFIFGTGLS
jgi:hypothetical protein